MKAAGADKNGKPEQIHGITIWLDGYDDIFSDFDSRDFSKRALSDDFLLELRKMSREEDGDIREFHLLLPEAARNKNDETIIVRRLHNYFRKNHTRISQSIASERNKAILFVLLGLIFLLLAGFISFLKPAHLALHFLMIACEPAGWFLTWMGFDMFIAMPRKRPELSFYSKMAQSGISFKSL